ncbi:23S rRNA (adenine(2503)-C(2))-methyltransferase RlmN [Candidatus Sumerlaeota bacterium]|nr:23S rRNA (adenine(2503)-C(2))-methyltransferase RlmN [Candidatus Sumerlaeota bacterium]
MSKQAKPYLIGRPLLELHADADRAGHKGFRAKQLYGWLYRNKIRDIDEPSNLSADYREFVREHYEWGGVEIAQTLLSKDGSRKFAFRLNDGKLVEGVLIPDAGRQTLCISSQVGCAADCKFCRTAQMGLVRQLRADEIVDQVRVVERLIAPEGAGVTNIVFMGMGEPLHNLKALIPALRLLGSPDAFAISTRRITVSTAGHVPGIDELAEAQTNASLAVSLNATTDKQRSQIMPINERYPIEAVLEACRRFPLHNRRRITFEYVMLGGFNDTDADAKRLVKLLNGIPHKINLIPWNPDPALPFKRPEPKRVEAFQQILLDRHESAFIRHSKGLDVNGACGQLATQLQAGD